MREKEIKMRWKEYLENLYEGNYQVIVNYIGIDEKYRINGTYYNLE